jgi:hypothetical protein
LDAFSSVGIKKISLRLYEFLHRFDNSLTNYNNYEFFL